MQFTRIWIIKFYKILLNLQFTKIWIIKFYKINRPAKKFYKILINIKDSKSTLTIKSDSTQQNYNEKVVKLNEKNSRQHNISESNLNLAIRLNLIQQNCNVHHEIEWEKNVKINSTSTKKKEIAKLYNI